ncbi:RagB/SusD family nutrient uptake outer membrane protein [Draconibacterium sp. IB214405]|uniref:RagB/SusD family nutrient uptake outer membrane protein n=1 Tax=Draconibacterium sp. IB214405 TaxID=3097352 RepID=UPI002A0C5BDB|nr:RagB/SusD family nutrient uptake outer membrane protein [Draconibacterium sp. IB214405]MDX8339346.1 RagB/SusD family nutrient uptake outer membrane protein [Draconibacterium sp. IB214405]
MKKIILFLLTSIILFACNDDMLELTPLDRISESAVWNDENLLQAYVNAQYNVIQDGFTNNLMYYSDEAYSQFDPSSAFGFRNNTLTADNVENLYTTLNFWETGYSYLYNLNQFFVNIEESAISDDAKTSLIAEMRFLRAYIYTTLLNSYGGVPIIDKVFDLSEELTGVTRNSYDEVLQYIIDDLDYVIQTLPAKQTGSDAGKASGDVAQAMKSRLLLYDARALHNPTDDVTKWQAASDAAAELLDAGYSLYPDYGTLFFSDGNSEIIWQRYYSPEIGHSFTFQSSAPLHGGWGLFDPTQNLVDDYEMSNGEMPYLEDGSVNPESGYDPDQFWVDRDPRFYELVTYPGFVFQGKETVYYKGLYTQDFTQTGYYNHKFLDPSYVIANTGNFTTPWIHYRLAEIYLNYAEAQYHLGNEDLARQYVNMVRARESVDMPPIDETGDELLAKIYHERRIELVYEGHRYFDIRTTKMAPETQSEPLIGNIDATETDEEYVYQRQTLLPGNWDDKFYYTPIPYSEIKRSNGSLEQNPGW